MYPPFEKLSALYLHELNGLSTEAVERSHGGNPACWNARQIVEHLLLTHQRSSATLRERLEKDRPIKARANAAQRVMRFTVLRIGYFPRGREAPPMVTPAAKPERPLDGNTLASLLRDSLESIDELLKPCEERFGKIQLATHQILGPLSARQWRQFHAAHARLHLNQIRRLHLKYIHQLAKKLHIPAEN
jgi:hypothetical protein